MKITAEFNSIREVLEFINSFGAKVAIQLEGAKVGSVGECEKSAPVKEETKIVDKVEDPKAESEKVGQANDVIDIKEDKEVKVTKEQVREIFSKLVKAGKQKEAKELTSKYGASKVGEVKEEDYATILKDAEGLL